MRAFCGRARPEPLHQTASPDAIRSKDCLAERETFEPSVQVVSLQVVNVCVGYREGGPQRIPDDCLESAQSILTSAVCSELERRIAGDTVAESGRCLQALLVGKFMGSDCLHSGQPRDSPCPAESTGSLSVCRMLRVLDLLCLLNDRVRGVAGHDPACRPGYDGFVLEPEESVVVDALRKIRLDDDVSRNHRARNV